MHSLSVEGNQFVMDDRPFRIIAGACHYFRVVSPYWKDRLTKLKACGLNTVETYVPWNLHEPRPGEFHFDGMLDIVRYIETAAELDLFVIVRPGPYICSEWDLGGLPAWLLADPAMKLRCGYPPYLAAVDRFFDALLPRLAPLQATRGGPIIAMQVENEYGSYGNDREYLLHLEERMRACGINVLLFTSDGASDAMLRGGTLPHLLKVANFGSKPKEEFAKLREHQPTGPLMCGEFWDGGFDWWGKQHHRRDAQEVAEVLDTILAAGASVNFYMFHGGTSFGWMSGANDSGVTCGIYEADVTSYDYGAPLDEAGDPTEKYHAFRKVIARYAPLPDIPVPERAPKRRYGTVEVQEEAPLFDNLPALAVPVRRVAPEPMEMLGQNYGFVLYSTTVSGPRESQTLTLQDVHDRAQVFVNEQYQGTVDRNGNRTGSPLSLAFGPGDHRLDILVENMGRINYGPWLHDRKGITHGVRLGNQFLFHWTILPLPLDDLSRLAWRARSTLAGPAFYRARILVGEPVDTFLALKNWTKGVCFLNGFNLGRYWNIGPQRTLYVPAPLLREGENELIIFELHKAVSPFVELVDTPELG